MAKNAKHEIVSDLKRLHKELGRAPSCHEYYKQGNFTQHSVRKEFRLFSNALNAAGLTNKKEKTINKIERPQLKLPQNELSLHSDRKLKVFCIPDMHLPWVCFESLKIIYERIEIEKPDIVIQLGDLYDFYAHSKYARSHDLCTPAEEIFEAYEMAKEFWKHIKKITKRNCRLIQLAGNHTDRIIKRVLEKYPELLCLVDVSKLFKFDDVEIILDSRKELEIEGVVYIHGYLTKIGDHCKHILKPVVHAHTHKAGTLFLQTSRGLLWELDCGFIANQEAFPLQYTSTKTTHWVKANGIVDKFGPKICPIT